MDIENIETNPPIRETKSGSWIERNGFADAGMALIWVLVAFFAFQIIVGVLAGVAIAMNAGSALQEADFQELLLANLDIMFIGNSAGQIIFFGLATIFVARLHTSRENLFSFLRFKSYSNTFLMAAATAVLVIAIQPVIWFFAWLNAQIPVPDFFEMLQLEQMKMIQEYLRGDHIIWLTLFHIGIVPAVCEEIMYRGYVMRAFEKTWSIWPAILISGLIFGLYHMQLTNLLPLTAIGIMLAYVTWVSKSIYPAMLAHLINNGGSVLVATYQPDSAFAELTPKTMPPLWAVGAGLIVSAYLVYFMYQQYQKMPVEGD